MWVMVLTDGSGGCDVWWWWWWLLKVMVRSSGGVVGDDDGPLVAGVIEV